MKGSKVITGVFSYLDDTLGAIAGVRQTELDYRVYAPTYIPDIEHATSETRSPVAAISLTGAILGLIGGFALAILCGLDWPLRVSAKDIVAIPGYVVIGYECTILLGAMFTLMAIFHFCRLPDPFRKVGYDPRFSHDKFGVVVGCEDGDVDKISELLTKAGADEVEVQDGL